MNEKIRDYVQFHRSKYAKRVAVFLVLAVFVVTGVFWRLKLTGITLAGEAFCGKDEHEHTAECLGEGCTRAEHIHDILCYSNPRADLETELDWEATLTSAPDTEQYTSDLIAVAESQLGYTESTHNFALGVDGARCGYTRYGQWYGNPYGEWSAMFVSFCLRYAGIPQEFAPVNSGGETMRVAWDEKGLLRDRSTYSPIPGDLIFFDTDADGNAEAVGVITAVSGAGLTVIQGDVEGAVAASNYLSNDGRILSYGSMNAVILASATEDELEYLEYTIDYIDSLPSYEEVEETLTSLETDMPAYEGYFKDVGSTAQVAYTHAKTLGRLLPLIPNYHKVRDLEWIWQSQVFNRIESIVDLPVYAVNPTTRASTGSDGFATVLYGFSPAELYPDDPANSFSNFQWWKAYVIAKDATQGYYVKAFYPSGVEKPDVKAPDGGFVYFVHDTNKDIFNAEIPIGTFLNLTSGTITNLFTPSGSSTYPIRGFTGAVLDTLETTAACQPKDPVDNSHKLTTVPTVNTDGYITINLFDYGEKISGLYDINEPFEANPFYPAFKLGSTADVDTDSGWDSLPTFGFDLGNLLAYDVKRLDGVNINGTINQVTNDNAELQGNVPLMGMMYPKLQGDYPAVYGDAEHSTTLSLQYLFHPDSGYTKKQNTANISHLLQYNEETGAYYYDSRNNFARFDHATNTFVVYDQIMSPGFAVYPFGNFMPLQDIRTQTTQVTSINREWFRNIAHSAWYKYVNAVDADYVDVEEYRDIYVAIAKLIPLMDAKYGTDWHYGNVLDEYFGRSATPDLPEPPAEGPNAQNHLSNLYTLDFDEPTNFHFGMDMHMEFMMPKDGMTGKGGKHEMVYKFAGDDDVWVYIDGVLFLDLSGTHRHVGGEINFAKGEVYYYYLNTAKGDVYTYDELFDSEGNVISTRGRVVTFKDLFVQAGYSEAEALAMLNGKGTFANYTEHSFDFYYMERGAGSGVCSMYFNMPLLQENRIEVIKEVDDGEAEAIGNPKFMFQILKEGTADPFIGAGVPYQAIDQNGNSETRVTGEKGVFYLYANERAVFEIPENSGKYFVRELLDPDVFTQYGEVVFEINGTTTTTDHYTDVVVGSASFKGVDSPVKDAGDGNTTFMFTNKVTVGSAKNFATLEILKTSKEYSDTAEVKVFAFSLLFGNKPVAVGTPYVLVDQNGNETAMTVTTEGQFTLKAGERVRFEKILAGTPVTVKEVNSTDYQVLYTAKYLPAGDVTATDNGDGSFTASTGATLTTEISVVNDRLGEKLTVEGEKELLYPDGEERTYTILLEQVTALDGLTLVPDGVSQAATVTLTESGAFSYTLNYPATTGAGTYYYRIYEQGADATMGDDLSTYILEVVVTKDGDAVDLSHTLYKNGAAVTELTFVNRNVRTLTVSKTVEGVSGNGVSFLFTLNATLGGAPLNGTFLTSEGTLQFVDGVASITLKHGETLTVLDLPYGTAWTVTEQPAAGFYTELSVDGGSRDTGSAASGELTANASVAYYNIGGAELPATGGFNRDLFPVVGAVLMLGSTAGAVLYRKKRKA